MEIDVREATTDDIDSICSVNRESIKKFGHQSYSTEQVSAWANAVTPELYPIDAEDTYFLVAERNKRIVAIGWMKETSEDTSVDGEITGIYVGPEIAKQGVGTQIYNELESKANKQNMNSLGLWASLNAVGFYEKQGYTQVTDQTLEYPDDIELRVIEMRKQLD